MSSKHEINPNEYFEFNEAKTEMDKLISIKLFKSLILKPDYLQELNKVKESAISELVSLYIQTNQKNSALKIFDDFSDFFNSIPKAKSAKIVRIILKTLSKHQNTESLQLEFCNESIEWCKTEKRSFLRQRIESKKAELLISFKKYKDALDLCKRLQEEIKAVDDKLLLLEVALLESQIHSELKNIPLAKSSLIVGKTAANFIYCPPELQAKLDLQSGNVALSEKDYKTSFSYFYESFEAYDTLKDKENALKPLKYMLLSKMLSDKPSDISSIIKGKIGQKYKSFDLDSILKIAEAYKKRSLRDFKRILSQMGRRIESDQVVANNLDNVYRSLLEKNILHFVRPFSVLQISKIAAAVDVNLTEVEKILSRMILDKKISGVIDQFEGNLILREEKPIKSLYKISLEVVENLEEAIDKIEKKARLAELM